MRRVLTRYLEESWARRATAAVVFSALWICFDLWSSFFSKEAIMCSWYPNSGLAIGFIVVFGWPMAVFEVLLRFLMTAVLWNVEIRAGSVFSYVLLPSFLSFVLAMPIRKAVRFKGRVESPRVALVLTAMIFIGTFAKSLIVQAANFAVGVLPSPSFLENFLIWWAGDLIGFVSVAPAVMAILGPWLLGSRPLEKIPLRAFAVAVVSLVLTFLFLFNVVEDRHFTYWHLILGVHVVMAWIGGFRWMTLQVIVVNFLFSILEWRHPSAVKPLEQQVFLAMMTGAGLYLAILFDDRRAKLRAMLGLTEAVVNAARKETEFLNAMSHELRTPLGVIIGYSDMMAEDPSASSKAEGLEVIRHEVEILKSTVQRLILLGSPDGAFRKATVSTFNVYDVVDEEVAHWLPAAQDKGLQIIWSRPVGDPASVTSIREHVRMTLDQLLENAVKFTSEGRISLRVGKGARDRFRIWVEDTGIGTDPTQPPFATFQQEASGLTRSFGGLGIGLSVCRQLMESIGGQIELEGSVKGVGSRFRIDLPSGIVEK